MGKKKKKVKVPEVVANGAAEESSSKSIDEGVQEKKYSVDDLLDRVTQNIENFDFDLAKKFCDKALKIAPENTTVLETYGNVCAEVGDIEKAKEYFQKAITLEPNKGHVKYLYLGQISDDHEAVENYEKAINIMKKTIEYSENNSQATTIDGLCQKDISNVFCSIAEIYMTDLCMENDAETQCEKYCKLAVETDENNAEAYIVMCNFLLSKDDIDTAKTTVEKAHMLWVKTSEICEDNVDGIISYESRITLIKILIEVECYEKVSSIVDQLIEENEDDIRIWYYLGLAKSLLIPRNDNPRFYLEKALELYDKLQYDDVDMKSHLNELLEQCPLDENMDTIEEDEECESESENEGKDSDEKMEDD